MACFWRWISGGSHALETASVVDQYVADHYYAVLLIQGQGDGIRRNLDENVFSIVAVVVGSVILAIVFGNVAMLVSNFNANETNYQRKMEVIFATMNKLKLPDALRERIHQYYAHLWQEYESLDGDVVRFSRELTHTLALEVGLFKYMNLVMDIPFWKDCSPDFVTQLVLNLDVRVYLPDDYVIRKGVVGDELYMINRGICEVHVDNKRRRRDDDASHAHSHRDKHSSAQEGTSYDDGSHARENDTPAGFHDDDEGDDSRPAFQQMLARYSSDRRNVLRRMLQNCIERDEIPFPWQRACAEELASRGPGPLTSAEAAEMLVNRIDVELVDETIKYGFQSFEIREHGAPSNGGSLDESSEAAILQRLDRVEDVQSQMHELLHEVADVPVVFCYGTTKP
ncbi:hypothetical protein ATCC90586_010107 [Pythium insidiosum]|nr:hypothetical protein ATCC90586_010107 [Pythium insidiosum]